MSDKYSTADNRYHAATCWPRPESSAPSLDEDGYHFVGAKHKMHRTVRRETVGYVLNKHWHVVPAAAIPSREDVEARFTELLVRWRKETAGFSLAKQKQYHPSYLKIIGLGEEALPLLLKQVKEGRRYLFLAIESISGVHLTPMDGTFEDAQRIWLRWGGERKMR